MGLLDPSTSDGRVIFFLPWKKSTMAGWCEHIFKSIIRPHRSTTYVDAACCYRPSNVVCRSVCLSVCLSVTLVSPAKTAAPIEMPFGLRTGVGSKTMWSRSPMGRGNLEEGKGHHIVKYRDTLRSSVQTTAEPIVILFGLWAQTGSGNHEVDGGSRSTTRRGSFWRKGRPL